MSKKKRKTKKRSSKKNPLFLINFVIVIFVIVIIGLLIKIFYQDISPKDIVPPKTEIQKTKIDEKTLQEQQAKYFEEKTQAMEIEYAVEDEEPIDDQPIVSKQQEESVFNFEDDIEEKIVQATKIVEKTIQQTPTKHTIEQKSKQKPKTIKHITTITNTKIQKKHINLPKLAIIIDDVTTSYQVRTIQKIPFAITMAFLPPTKRHLLSAKIAKNIDHYMIHLPLEAGSKHFEEQHTLHIKDNITKIDKRIKELKKLYPKATFINNHTGSKFTANSQSMDRLLQVFQKYNYNFLDSRTTAKTVAKKYAKKYNVKYLYRNIFLDNKRDKQYIKKQLQRAINIAKKYGTAIAIGHPHSITLKTLSQSKNMLKGLDVIYINEM